MPHSRLMFNKIRSLLARSLSLEAAHLIFAGVFGRTSVEAFYAGRFGWMSLFVVMLLINLELGTRPKS
jgi:hypothetical protein